MSSNSTGNSSGGSGGGSAQAGGNVFDPAALIHSLQTLLPSTPTSTSSSSSSSSSSSEAQPADKPQLANPYDALAALAHTFMTAVGFRLVGLGEDHRLTAGGGEGQNDGSAGADTIRLPGEWNARGPESYAFRYRHTQSAMEFVLKIVRMGGRALIHALAIEDNKTATLDIQVADYTSASFFPYPCASSSSSSGSTGAEPLVHGFISSARVQDLASLFKINIIQKLVPGLRKEGYHEEEASSLSVGGGDAGPSTGGRRAPQPPPQAPERDFDPLLDPRFVAPRPRGDRPAGEGGGDDGFGSAAYNPFAPGRNPATIGDRDLNPLGIPPGRFGGGPPPLFGGGGDHGGGMIVGPDHPLFRDRFGPARGGGLGEGGGVLPRGAVPPGARFDPIGPLGPLGPGGPGPRRPPGGGPGRGGGIGGDPDWDDLPPPRNSDYDNMFM